MKRLPMITILLAACFAFLFIGANTFVSVASSAQIRHASPNYYYLTDPKMLTADAGNVYVINEEGSGRKLFAFNTSGNWDKDIPSYTSISNVLFIKHAGNYIFLFEEDGFTTISYNSTLKTFSQQSAKTQYRTTGLNSYQLFDVAFVSNNVYRVFFASTSVSTPQYGWIEFQFNASVWQRTANSYLSPNFTESNSIKAIACDGANTLYMTALAIWEIGERYNIYQIDLAVPTNPSVLPPVNSHPLSRFSSFSVVQGKGTFVYINGNKGLTLFDRNYEDAFVISPDNTPPTAFRADANRDPYFVATTNPNYAYVIDKEKLSIDRYITKSDSTLEFDKVVVAHLGADRGFLNTPTSVTLINSSVRKGTDITSSEYIITDRAGQVMYNRIDASGKVTSKSFFDDSAARLSTYVRATYDNFDTVYIYDYSNQQFIVRTFSLDGKYKGNEFTGFGHVTHMFADANRTIYALDAAQGVIHAFGVTTQRTSIGLPAAYSTQTTKAVYSEQLDAIILVNATNEILVMSTDGTYDTLTLGENVIDIATDTLGNLVLLTKESGKYYVSLYDRNGLTFATTPTFRHEIEGATVDTNNPSLNLDRMNQRILFIGERHAIESFELEGTGIWTPADYVHNESWKNNKEALKVFNPPDNSTPIFLEAKKGAVIYQFPGGTRALSFAPENSVLKVLDYSTYYVLYENPQTGEYITGYVSKQAMSNAQPYAEKLEFSSARVIFSYTIVYKYPTTDSRSLASNESLAIMTLDKNFEQPTKQTGGLRIMNLLENCTDVHGFSFYEIRLHKNANGTYTPTDANDTTATYVGYVNKRNVINYYLGPSTEKFIPNATVRIPASHNLTGIQVYERSSAGTLRELPYEILKHKQSIRVTGNINKSSEYTYIRYYDSVTERLCDGWIKTEYIVMNGLSAWQLIAIAILCLIAIGGLAGVTIYIKRRR